MLLTLLKHEIQILLRSKRVYWTVFMFLLLFLSIFIVRLVDYQKQVNQYIADVQIHEESLQSVVNYSFIKPRAIQQPIIFSIFNEGFRFPRVVTIQFYEPIYESGALNEENNLLYIDITQLDITFLITFFLSLFILLISYDSVNGEKSIGTLRVIMTYPIKRQSFILKKLLGVFIFVAFIFSIPYFLSLISLIIIYANLLSLNFFFSAFFYWFLVLLFILFFSLLGIFISTCSTNPNRSLVYSLLIWVLFSIILPISWDYIISPRIYNEKFEQLSHNFIEKHNLANRLYYIDVPDDADLNKIGHMNWSGDFYEATVWGLQGTYEQHYRFQRYMYEVYFPVSRDIELIADEIYRTRISMENMRSRIFFYNPIVLLNNLSMKITGNSNDDYLLFLQNSREIRDDLINLGVNEGWLFDYRFFTMFTEEYNNLQDYWIEMYKEYDEDDDKFWAAWDTIWARVNAFSSKAEFYEMELPHIKPYEQPHFTLAFIIPRIFNGLSMLVLSILVLWVMTWIKFMKYDVR